MIIPFIKKLFTFGAKTRRSRREKVQPIHEVLFFVGESSFKPIDMSLNGFAIKNENNFVFVIGDEYKGVFECFGQESCPVTFKVARIVDKLIGCDVTNGPSYVDFFNDFKLKILEDKVEKNK